ncbi:hypothetical protein HMPREF9402_2876 [Turicibacter sp. HGF1]|uniref:restriction endonuclease subunit S n=1 Tax=Turicibacter sp. HGF1 TaxID=910310 RepID=UPI0001FD7FF8|nr:restriction endonuclease subunit S [Turicibacter sp. HGF1]EGC92664.1 hypothetical protein HMPREF9402_2876 [Turicibacter sp. HGF1]
MSNHDREMKKVLLIDYFDIRSSIQDDKINFEVSDINDYDAVPFLGRSAVNNGIVDYVKRVPIKINNGGVITIALDGSTGSTFYQFHEFSSGQNIWILTPKGDKLSVFTPDIALFLVTTIRKAVTNYTYNLSLTKTRLSLIKVYLPLNEDDTIDVGYIQNRMSKLRHANLLDEISQERIVQ